MVDVDVLDRDVREGHAEEEGAGPPVLRERGQGCAIADNHEHLGKEDRRQHVPHVDHPTVHLLGPCK